MNRISRSLSILAILFAAACSQSSPDCPKEPPLPAPVVVSAQPCVDTHVPLFRKGQVIPIPQDILGAKDGLKNDPCMLSKNGKLTALEDEHPRLYLFAGEYVRSSQDGGNQGWECKTGRVAFGRPHVKPLDVQDAEDRRAMDRVFDQQH